MNCAWWTGSGDNANLEARAVFKVGEQLVVNTVTVSAPLTSVPVPLSSKTLAVSMSDFDDFGRILFVCHERLLPMKVDLQRVFAQLGKPNFGFSFSIYFSPGCGTHARNEKYKPTWFQLKQKLHETNRNCTK